PLCQQKLSVPDASGGKRGKCPGCNNTVDIPAAAPAGDPFAGAPADAGYQAAPQQSYGSAAAAAGGMAPTDQSLLAMLLGIVALIACPTAVLAGLGVGKWLAIINGLLLVGLAGLGVFFAIMAMLKGIKSSFWVSIVGVILTGASTL